MAVRYSPGRTGATRLPRRSGAGQTGAMKRVAWLCGSIWVTRGSVAQARTLLVPRDHATIQQAIAAASAGDEVLVSPGRHCGATIDRPIALRAAGQAVIVGCDGGPTLHGKL